MSRLYTVLDKLATDVVVARGTTNSWDWKKYSDGTIEAIKTLTSGNTWTVVSNPIAYNSTRITPPPEMSQIRNGRAMIRIQSMYIIGAQVQMSGSDAYLTIHRLATSTATITCDVVLYGTWS